jgi:hypothetical protein
MHPTRRRTWLVLVVLSAAACALPSAGGANGAAQTRVILVGKQHVLVLAGTGMRCLLDLDSDLDDRPVAVKCLVVDPKADTAFNGTGIPPQPAAGSYVVHASFWGGALLTRAKRSDKKVNGVPLAYEEVVAKRSDTLRGPRGYSFRIQTTTITSDPFRRVSARLGDFVRFAGTKLTCSFARSTKGVPTFACILVDRSRIPVPGAHGFLIGRSTAAIAIADASRGLYPVVVREHGR